MMKRLSVLLAGLLLLVGGAVPAFAHNDNMFHYNHDRSVFSSIRWASNWDGCDWTWEPNVGDLWVCGHWHLYSHYTAGVYSHSCWVGIRSGDVLADHTSYNAFSYWYNPAACWS